MELLLGIGVVAVAWTAGYISGYVAGRRREQDEWLRRESEDFREQAQELWGDA